MSEAGSFAEKDRELVAAAAEVLEEFRARLARAGLSFRGPEVQVWVVSHERYASELRITFYRNSDVHDVLEFFLFRDGRQIVSDDEVRTWMLEQLDEMISR